MRRCRNCLCRTCLKSCKCQSCKMKITDCKEYSGFRQLSIFEPLEKKYNKAPRYPWEYYGISKQRHKQLTAMMLSGEYAALVSAAAHTANKDIAEYILLSVREKLSYDGLQRLWDLREIERMACGRSDFYGYRRYFYHIFNGKVKEIGK